MIFNHINVANSIHTGLGWDGRKMFWTNKSPASFYLGEKSWYRAGESGCHYMKELYSTMNYETQARDCSLTTNTLSNSFYHKPYALCQVLMNVSYTGLTMQTHVGYVCPRHMYVCGSGECILAKRVCDEHSDCADGSDENACSAPCSPGYFMCTNGRCVPMTSLCDFINQCGDNSDEYGCGKAVYIFF